jgi:hypothetical protein
VITIALAVGALFMAGAASAMANNNMGTRCGNGACIEAWNAYKGSSYVTEVDVWDQANPGLHATYAWTLNGYIQNTATGYGGAAFHPNRALLVGACISGFVDGVTGSAPCLYVP